MILYSGWSGEASSKWSNSTKVIEKSGERLIQLGETCLLDRNCSKWSNSKIEISKEYVKIRLSLGRSTDEIMPLS